MLIRRLKEEYIIDEMKGNNFDVIYQFNKESRKYKSKRENKIIENKFIVYCNENKKIYYVEVIEDILEEVEIKNIKVFKEINLKEATNIKKELDEYLLEESIKCDRDISYIALDDYRIQKLNVITDEEINYSILFSLGISVKLNLML